tara:strand:+ start:101 stop:391 length:291 start_codon:yes stop_codon:yes gene_type:complete
MQDLQEELKNVILNVGDLIVDESTGYVGLLLRRERRVDILYDDLYFWHIKWIKNINRYSPDTAVHMSDVIEEEGMKLSIVVGMLTIYPAGTQKHEF